VFAKVVAKVFAVTDRSTDYLEPAPPLETLGYWLIAYASAEPDYPPSTCYVRVVRLGFGCRADQHVGIRGQGRAEALPEFESRSSHGSIVGRSR
jgi:hypothetical protein